MKKILNIFLLFGLSMSLMLSCSKDDSSVESSAKAVTSFMVDGETGTIDESDKTIFVEVSRGTDITSLSPDIEVSPKSTVNPASGTSQDFSNPVVYTVTAEDGSSSAYTTTVVVKVCVNAEDIYSFSYNGKRYEIVRTGKTWEDAAACAVERGGYLAEINDASENEAIFEKLTNDASITNSNTAASDGGGASYVWIGGNDIATEGVWIWNGNNDGTSTQFWQGDKNGNAVGGLYSNWGNEPDNYLDQDGLGLAITEWPLGTGTLGSAGQWNDVDDSNNLYFVIEFD